MGNKSQAVYEVLKCQLDNNLATRLFNKAYIYLMYNDGKGFHDLLDYRMNLCKSKEKEDYYVFKFLLQLMVKRHYEKLQYLYPEPCLE